jgi:hypothetical protein
MHTTRSTRIHRDRSVAFGCESIHRAVRFTFAGTLSGIGVQFFDSIVVLVARLIHPSHTHTHTHTHTYTV